MGRPQAVSDFSEVQLRQPLHLAIGMFDGIHLGHQAVIESALNAARLSSGVGGVLTFTPHPSRILTPQNPTLLLMPDTIKAQTLFRLGVRLLINKPFTLEYAGVQAKDFLPLLHTALPTLASIHVGENFRYGQARKGDIAQLEMDARRRQLNIYSVDRIKYNGEPISSSRIRRDIATGNMPEVNTMLGYNYYTLGAVIPGSQRGRTMGYPTLNFAWQPELPPRYGVYAVTLSTAEGQERVPAVANYGVRPTVTDDTTPVLEVHRLTNQNIPHDGIMRVEWHDFIRPEQKFSGMDALKAQIGKDVAQARAVFET